MNLYLTADKINTPTGGGLVTHKELEAFKSLNPLEETKVISRTELLEKDPTDVNLLEPWKWDQIAHFLFGNKVAFCHLYSGTFSESVKKIKGGNGKVSYTIAAHNRHISRMEHEKFGIDFAKNYPHLVEEPLWKKYIEGYRLADVIICPSAHSAAAVRAYGGDFETKRIEIIPHGCSLPEKTKPLPKHFTVGYLGSYGCDKGVIYLLQAWKKLAYKDAVLLLGGADSCSDSVYEMVKAYGGGSIMMMGWVKKVSDFYDGISLYVQPSCTEGFGLEVLEAMAHKRPVLVSKGAGASDLIPSEEMLFKSRDVAELAAKLDVAKKEWDLTAVGEDCRRIAEQNTWPQIQAQYLNLWKDIKG